MSDYKQDKKLTVSSDNVTVDYNFERMLKFFSKQVQKDGILEEVKRRRYYTKPSEIKRLGKTGKKR